MRCIARGLCSTSLMLGRTPTPFSTYCIVQTKYFIPPRWCRISSINGMFGFDAFTINMTLLQRKQLPWRYLFSIQPWLLEEGCSWNPLSQPETPTNRNTSKGGRQMLRFSCWVKTYALDLLPPPSNTGKWRFILYTSRNSLLKMVRKQSWSWLSVLLGGE